MSSLDKEILNCLKKIKRRIHRNTIFSYVVWGAILALGLGSLLSLAGLLLPLYKVHVIALKFLGAGIAAALLVGLTEFPKDSKAARLADSMGLKERVTTSMEFIGVEEGFAVIQKKDTLKRLNELDYKEALSFSINRRQIILALIFITIILGSMAIPTPAKSLAEKKYRFEIMQEKKIDSIAQTEREIKNNPSLGEEDKKELLENLNSLKKEIKEAKSISDIDNSLTKFQIKMDSMQKKYQSRDLDNLASGLSRNGITADLAQAIERGDKVAIDNQIKQLPETLKNASEEEQKKVAESFANMAKSTESDELKKSLSEVAEKLAQNNPDKLKELAESLGNLNSSVQKNVDNKLAKNELKGIQSDFLPEKPMDNKASAGEGKTGNEGSPQQGGDGKEQGSGSGEGQKPEEGNKQDPGKLPEEGSGSGSQLPEGSASEQKPGESEGLNKPQNNKPGGEESVYVPSTGSEGGSGEVVKEGTLPPPSEPAKPQSLDKVIGKYKEKAYENMNSYVLPEAMKDIIKSYFSALEQ